MKPSACDRKCHSEHGFTLVELLVVIAIASVISTIAVWGAVSMLPGYRLNGAVGTVRSDMYQAKILAANTKNQHKVVFGATSYAIQEGPGWNTVLTRNLSREFAGIGVDAADVGTEVIFEPRGTITAVNADVVIENDKGESRTLKISRAGRIKID